MTKTNEEKILDILSGMQGGMLAAERRMDSMENELLKTRIAWETELVPRLDALAEGHTAIRNLSILIAQTP